MFSIVLGCTRRIIGHLRRVPEAPVVARDKALCMLPKLTTRPTHYNTAPANVQIILSYERVHPKSITTPNTLYSHRSTGSFCTGSGVVTLSILNKGVVSSAMVRALRRYGLDPRLQHSEMRMEVQLCARRIVVDAHTRGVLLCTSKPGQSDVWRTRRGVLPL